MMGEIGVGAAISFVIGGELTYAIVAAACSSPQTAEINANKRADTLMKWVHLGLVQSAVFVGAGAWIASKTGGDPAMLIAGGVLAGGMMYGSYWYALKSGENSSQPGTES
jgi:hypothetical protein